MEKTAPGIGKDPHLILRLATLRAEVRRLEEQLGDLGEAPASAPFQSDSLEDVFRGPTPTILIDAEERITRANPAFFSTFGLPHAVGQRVSDLLGPQFRPTHTPWPLPPNPSHAWDQREMLAIDGRRFLRRSIPVPPDRGEPAVAVVTFTAIHATGALEERLKLAMASARLVWWDWDFRTGILATYGDTDCLLGYHLDTLPRTSTAWFERTHPEDLPALQAAVESCLAERAREWSLEHRFRAADGSWRWVLNSGKLAEPDPLGRPTRMLGLTLDIHARRSAEEDLRRDARILAHLHDVVLYCDAEYRIVYVNDAFEAVFGFSREQALGQNLSFRLPAARHAEVRAQQDSVLAGVALDLEWEDYRADGSRIWIHWRCQRIVNAEGAVIGIINIGTNIDARKRAEGQREALQHQLIQAQRMETLGNLAGGIAHDFNNILAAIFGFTELALTTTNPGEESKHYHQQVLKASERARELVRRILSFSRFHEPERRPLQLHDLIVESGKFIRAALPSTVELSVQAEEDCPPTLADSHQLNQVLLNLATNASHAIGNRPGRLAITLRRATLAASTPTATGPLPAGPYLVIEVADDGHGMDEATQARIFDPFFTTKKDGEGTGLGLSVVSAILRGHNGGITVQSAPDRGTTFAIFLPHVADVTVPAVRSPAVLAPRLRARGETIAIVEDEEAIAAATEKILQGLGYTTRSYSSGQRFLQEFLAAPESIHLVLTDQTMPQVTGLEVALRIRDAGHTIPVLFMTGFSTQLSPELVTAIGASAVIRKPFELLELARTVRSLLDATTAAKDETAARE